MQLEITKDLQLSSQDSAILDMHSVDVFSAIEKNSKGKYRFLYNLAAQDNSAYFLHLKFESVDQEVIRMPPVFQDVMRDLIANARKYTAPGGKVLAGLLDDGQSLRFTVEDTGRGIPEKELEKVVDFGYRGSNVEDKPTMGGGFGVTKAYWVTKKFRGRMWIDSGEGRGTRIDIHIPRPKSV
ncbi:MAG: sensor histidine kinase [Desulfohalobiaceae bacterium]